MNPDYNLKDRVYYSLAAMSATCTCDTCRPRVEALLVSLQGSVHLWALSHASQEDIDRAFINVGNTLNQLRRLHHRPTHHEVIA